MQNSLTKRTAGVLAIVMVAGLGYFVLMSPTAPAVQAAPSEISSHCAECVVCRLPLYGPVGAASRLGADSHAADATHQGTIR